MKSDQQRKKSNHWVGLFFIGLAATLVLAAFLIDSNPNAKSMSSGGVSQQSSLSESPTDEQINAKIKDTTWRLEIKRKDIELENEAAPPLTDPSVSNRGDKNVLPLTFEQDSHVYDVMKEIESKGKRKGGLTPDERISLKLQVDNWMHEHRERLNKEYVRQFLLNAKAKGIEIKLNEDLDVVGLEQHPVEEPLRIPQSLPQNPK